MEIGLLNIWVCIFIFFVIFYLLFLFAKSLIAHRKNEGHNKKVTFLTDATNKKKVVLKTSKQFIFIV